MLGEAPGLPGSHRCLVTYAVPDDLAILDLDDARALLRRRLKPSQVVTRDRAVTQAWALRIHGEGGHAGVRWWSYYNPDWGSIGLWDRERIEVGDVTPLTRESPELETARQLLLRTWVRGA